MKKNIESYSKKILVEAHAKEVYNGFTQANEIKKWWDKPEGNPGKVGNLIHFDFHPTHWDMKIVELIPNQRVKWLCTRSHVVLSDIPDLEPEEWEGTELIWQIEQDPPAGTHIWFIHKGLTPQLMCFEACSAGWNHYFVENFSKYIERK